MPVWTPAHLQRNRHGSAWYFRAALPAPLRHVAKRSEVRLSLQTEVRSAAIITARFLAADWPRLLGELRHMADQDQTAPDDYFIKWREEIFRSSALRKKVELLNEEINELREQLSQAVPKETASKALKIAHEKGQLKGRIELEERLVFPWPPERTCLFSELGQAYLKGLNHRADGGRKKPPSEKAQDKYRKDIELFIRIMGDVRIGAIDREVTGEYFRLLKRLPPNINKSPAYRDKTINEILSIKPAPEPQSEVTISGKMVVLSGIFKWALEEKRKWGIDSNPFSGFSQAESVVAERRPFTSDELKKLFSHEAFVKRDFFSAYSYWLIPLALFTGARLGELCQLDLADFVEVDGIPCIDINDIDAPDDLDDGSDNPKRGKRLKTRNAKRLVPIHPELIRLGLLRYVEQMRAKRQVHLFPELSRTRRDGPGHAASNWFQRFRKKVGLVEKQETVFHSFRHQFITTLLDGGVSEHTVAPIVGHEAKLITGQVYWNRRDATKRKPTVDAFVLDADVLALIPAIEDVSFVESRYRRVAK